MLLHLPGTASAIRQKRESAAIFNHIGNSFYVIRPEERQISQFAEMHLDGHEFS